MDTQPFLPFLQDFASASETDVTRKRRIRAIPRDRFPIVLATALTAENLAFTTYSLMLAVSHTPDISLARLSSECGMTYHAARHQLDRTPWFDRDQKTGDLVRVNLNPAAREKLTRISNRLAKA